MGKNNLPIRIIPKTTRKPHVIMHKKDGMRTTKAPIWGKQNLLCVFEADVFREAKNAIVNFLTKCFVRMMNFWAKTGVTEEIFSKVSP